MGYHTEVILAGGRINDGMGKFIAERTVKQMIAAGSYVNAAAPARAPHASARRPQ